MYDLRLIIGSQVVITTQQCPSDGDVYLTFTVLQYVNITFHSSVIEDAVPPSCIISWDGSYLDPTTTDPRESPLPSCWTRESREGYHMTYFWFRLLEWVFF